MKILALNTGLFPDRETLDAALAEMAAGHHVRRLDLPPPDADDTAWDAALSEVLAADMIVTT